MNEFKISGRHQISGWVMRCIEDNRLCVWSNHLAQFTEVKRPMIFFARNPKTDITANGTRHLRQRLIARGMHDHMIACLEDGMHEQKDRLFGARMNEDILRLHGFIQAADRLTQGGAAL